MLLLHRRLRATTRVRAQLGVKVFKGEQQSPPDAAGRCDVASRQRHPKCADAQAEVSSGDACIDVARDRARRACRRLVAIDFFFFFHDVATPAADRDGDDGPPRALTTHGGPPARRFITGERVLATIQERRCADPTVCASSTVLFARAGSTASTRMSRGSSTWRRSLGCGSRRLT
jgi:hypothetical protein